MTTSSSTAQTASLSAGSAQQSARVQRYIQLALVLLAAGTIYPMLYLRKVYEVTILEFFKLNDLQLGTLYSILGTMFVVCYMPSGWLADRVRPRILISFSLVMTGALGYLYSTAPSYETLCVIYACWGVTTGLTFWSAIIKRVNSISLPEERGRFFGILDGGRGLVEAALAVIALTIFSYFASQNAEATGFRVILLMYATLCVTLGAILFCLRDPQGAEKKSPSVAKKKNNLWADLKTLARIPELWILAAVVFCGYQMFWVSYKFSAFVRLPEFGTSATIAATITVAMMWMRPIGGVGGGFLADKFSRELVLAGVLVCGALGLAGLSMVPAGASVPVLLGFVLLLGMLGYAVRGLYWALVGKCGIPDHCVGLAIGMVSMIGYSPDIFLPKISAYLTTKYAGVLGYRYFFGYIIVMALLGAVGAVVLRYRFGRLAKTAKA